MKPTIISRQSSKMSIQFEEVVRVFRTGIPTCDQLREITFSGNVIPQIWYRVFVKSDLKHPKPHLLAINILADIVYWYRPREIRDESSGQIIGYQKKFRDDLLQRSYTQIAEQFGCSPRQAKDAVVFLEQMGVVRRVFRTIEAKGMVYNNVLYIDLDVNRLRELTYPTDESTSANTSDHDTPVSEFCQRGDEISSEPVSEFRHTNTENTIQEITTENSINLSSRDNEERMDGLVESQIAEQVISEITTSQQIPYTYSQSPKKMQAAIRWLCEYDFYMKYPCEKTDLKTKDRFDNFVLLVNSLVSMATRNGTQTYSGEQTNACAVIDAINAASECCGCGTLSEMIFSALDDFTDALASTHIKNYAGYAKSVLWNSLNSYRVKQNTELAVI